MVGWKNSRGPFVGYPCSPILDGRPTAGLSIQQWVVLLVFRTIIMLDFSMARTDYHYPSGDISVIVDSARQNFRIESLKRNI
jgi:hypothetical protein